MEKTVFDSTYCTDYLLYYTRVFDARTVLKFRPDWYVPFCPEK